MNYSIATIAKIIKAESESIINDQSIDVLLTDSRSLVIPEKSLFFALNTSKNDGHNYIVQLYLLSFASSASLPAMWTTSATYAATASSWSITT